MKVQVLWLIAWSVGRLLAWLVGWLVRSFDRTISWSGVFTESKRFDIVGLFRDMATGLSQSFRFRETLERAR